MVSLVLVESKKKVSVIDHLLQAIYGPGRFKVAATLGHVRDLPSGELGVDVEQDFQPHYVQLASKSRTLGYLRQQLKRSEALYLASDPDREGEAIAWHLVETLKPQCPVYRVRFNALTASELERAFNQASNIDLPLVRAQEARRILDRLVGFTLSPALWRALDDGKLSAGRVQSVALRLVVEREQAIDDFVPSPYWQLIGDFIGAHGMFRARLSCWRGETIKCFEEEAALQRVIDALQGVSFTLADLQQGERRRKPPAPFITSTLQQAASSRLGFKPAQTMQLAQALYEEGRITYLRTDSPAVATEAIRSTALYIRDRLGIDYLPRKPRNYPARDGAQAGHECIRPTALQLELMDVDDAEQRKLYALIWRRFLASQMADAVYKETVVRVQGSDALFEAKGRVLAFDGFLAAWTLDADEDEQKVEALPLLTAGETLQCATLTPEKHMTKAPPRYTEASLIHALETSGVGRPATFAETVNTIQLRAYVRSEGRTLTPTTLGAEVLTYLLAHFASVIAVDFTAKMERGLDRIAADEVAQLAFLKGFWSHFAPLLTQANIALPEPQADVGACPVCGAPLRQRHSPRGPFLGCSTYPKCHYTRDLTQNVHADPCPRCGGELLYKSGKRGAFLGCANYPQCRYTQSLNNDAEENNHAER